MHILVTGSSGTIGTRLCEALLAAGHAVIGLDRRKNAWQPSVQAITVLADLLDKATLQNVPKDIDAVIHLAANARVYELVEDPPRALENFTTLFHTLEWCRENRIPRFLFASSRECYGNASHERYTEDLVRVEHCESPYTASKLGGEALVQSYTRCYGLPHIMFRFSNVYGMYDDSDRVVPLFIRRMRKNEPITVFGKEKCLDFTYIDDTVQGIIGALTHFNSAKNETYNIAYGEGTTLIDLAEQIQGLLKSSSTISIGTPRTGEVIRYIADTTKAQHALQFAATTPFTEGIKKTVAWYLQHA
jgi:UDP-glucose 4-epimerase